MAAPSGCVREAGHRAEGDDDRRRAIGHECLEVGRERRRRGVLHPRTGERASSRAGRTGTGAMLGEHATRWRSGERARKRGRPRCGLPARSRS